MRVDYGKTVHGNAEIEAVIHVLRTSTQMSKHVGEFERRVAALFGKKHGIMVNSGSSALVLAVETLKLPPGSEVITPALTFATTVGSIVRNGCVPAYVDAAPDTYNIDVERIEEMITDKTRAMVIPNLIGNLPNWQAIRAIADKHSLFVVEDSADTLGATIDGKNAGSFSNTSTTSFYGSHVINCGGNGGMLCTNDDEVARSAKLLRSWGRSSSLLANSESIASRFDVELEGIPYDRKFIFEAVGHNFEPSEMGAAFGLIQLDQLEKNIDARERNFQWHTRFFERYPNLFSMPKQLPGARTGWLAFPMIIRPEAPFSRRDFQIALETADIQTRTVFTGNILRQPGFRDVPCKRAAGGYPEADRVMRGGVLLGCHHGLTDEQIAYLHHTVEQFIAEHA
jgi:CDP-6-deoxy-D-xylo-4-hexulose-3-dehydrase